MANDFLNASILPRMDPSDREDVFLSLSTFDGHSLTMLERFDLHYLGVPAKYWTSILEEIEWNKIKVDISRIATEDNCSDIYGLSDQTVLVETLVTDITAIDDTDYTFSATFVLREIWHDDRYQYLPFLSKSSTSTCTLQLRETTEMDEARCGDNMWAPIFYLLNAQDFSLLHQDITTSETSVMRTSFVRGTFSASMSFGSFPYDEQELQIQIAYERSNASRGIALIRSGMNDPPGWSLRPQKMTSRLTSLNFLDAADFYYFIPPECTSTSPIDPISVLTVVVVVERVWQYYVYNIVVPITFLSAIGCQVFFVPAKSIDARLAITLTVFLALVAFQFITTEQLPKSSEMNRVHVFILLTGALFVCVAVECVVAFTVANGSIRKCFADRPKIPFAFPAAMKETRLELSSTVTKKKKKKKGQEETPSKIDNDRGARNDRGESLLSNIEKGAPSKTFPMPSASPAISSPSSTPLLPQLPIDRISCILFPVVYLAVTVALFS